MERAVALRSAHFQFQQQMAFVRKGERPAGSIHPW
jgi:hypothetical protein